jgi:PAS domain S-box-containing protein
MTTELRKTGIEVLGDISWGTHICHFYETKQDLLDTLVPYFKAGLENGEFCLWVISAPLKEEEARKSLREAVPELDRYLAEYQIEIVSSLEWYLKDGRFDPERVISDWNTKLKQALTSGYAGMRVNLHETWLKKKDNNYFLEYEKELNHSITGMRMIVMCTFPVAMCGASAILDVARAHQFVVALRKGVWEVIETSELKQAKAEIERLNGELEQRVVERTRELAETNDALRVEIFQRERTEKSLQQALEHTESVLSSVADIHILFDRQWRYFYVNQAAARSIGRPPEQILGRTLWEVFPDIAGTEIDRQYHRAMDERLPAFEFYYPTLDAWWENRFNPSPEGLSVFATDITQRKKAEEALRESEKRFRSYFELGLVGTAITSPDKGFLEVNDKFCEIFGYERSELMRMTWVELLHPDDVAADVANFNRILAGKIDGYSMGNYIRKDGRVIDADLSVKCLCRADGSVEYCVVHLQDITERKRAEKALRSYAQRVIVLEEEMRRKLSADLHDDLGRDLTAIGLNITIISNALSRNSRDKLGERIKDSSHMIEKMGRDVREMMIRLRPPVLDDYGLLAALRWLADLFAKRTGIAVDIQMEEIEPRLSGEVELAFFRIAQEALTNITKHADASCVTLRLGRYEGRVRLLISDYGRGFESRLNKPSDPGVGWGLTIMRERAELVGARFCLDSKPGRGTVISVETGEVF